MHRPLGLFNLFGTRWVLLAGFGGLLLVLAALGLSSVLVLDQVERVEQDETRRFISQASDIHQLRDRLLEAFSATRNYLLGREHSDSDLRKQRLDAIWRRVDSALDVVRSAPLHGQADSISQIFRETTSYREVVDGTRSRSQEWLNEQGYDILSQHLDPTRARILSALDDVLKMDQEHLRTAFAASTAAIAALKAWLRLAIVLALALGLGLAALSIWQVVRLETVAQDRYQALTEAYEEQGRLAQRLLDVQEQERKSLARELHDEVSQSLGAMLVEMASLSERSPQLEAARTIGSGVLNSIRNMCLLLRPSMLDDLGLVAALHWQARETLRRSGIRVSVTADDIDMDLPDLHRTTVYRIVQETLQNVVLHSGAKQVEIVVRRENRRLTVVVQDDGRGFNPDVTRGLGLLGMQERVHRLNGSMQVVSESGKGTILSFLLPVELGMDYAA